METTSTRQNEELSAAFVLAQGKKSRSLRRLWWALRSPELREELPVTEDANEDNLRYFDEVDSFSYPTSNGDKTARTFALLNDETKPVIAYVSGWKSHPLENTEMEMLSSIRDAGYNVIATALDDPGKETDSLDANINRVTAFLFSQSSPVYTKYAHGINSVIGLTHSTSSMACQHGINESEIPEQLRAVVNTAPFFDTANSSSLEHPLKNQVYTWHAMRHQDEFAGDPLSDRLHYYVCGIAERLRYKNAEKRPTHGQILEISAFGMGAIAIAKSQQENDLPASAQQLEQLFVISEDDSFACPETAKIYADLIGADKILVEHADHNPLLKPEARADVLERIGNYFETEPPVMDIHVTTEAGLLVPAHAMS